MTLAEAQANLALIETAMATGERSVQFGDRSVVYRSFEELLQARTFWAGQVAALGATVRPRQAIGTSDKGL